MIFSYLKSTAKSLVLHGIASAKEIAGAKRSFGIRGGYQHRTAYTYFDDTPYADEYQREVYQCAAEIAQSEKVKSVYDVGCGSGFKLVKYLGRYDTTGFDVPETLAFLRHKYPERKWIGAPFSDRSYPPGDLVICSDVIEHVLDPDELMGFLMSLTRRWLVISTPDRRREYSALSRHQLGPPHTDHHIREWNFDEFHRYIGAFVDIQKHIHPHNEHSTQMIVAKVRSQ